ncbi:MAG TPA: hypothetical protein VK468_04760 [Pyrinomonadaceae bacterium]|nr:hypothetical protein [Pyrinomonadaceae bacterium]
MKNYRAILRFTGAISVICTAYAAVAFGQTVSTTSSPSRQRINLYHHLGSVELPEGFKGYVTANWIDAWAGYIESKDASFKVGWAAGMIQHVSEKRKKDVVWQREITSKDLSFKLSLLRNNKGDTMVARIGWLEFDSSIRSKKDEELFMSVIRSFQKQRCTTCRSFLFKTQN